MGEMSENFKYLWLDLFGQLGGSLAEESDQVDEGQ
jgi:hypothetical protein